MKRPSRHEMFLNFAAEAARRSVCGRQVQVGCVVTNWSGTNVESIGYNGPARGLAHATCGGSPTTPGACSCVHAETNAIIKAPYGPQLRLYTTLSPCADCARLILNSTIREVIYGTDYRSDAGIHILVGGGIQVLRLGPGSILTDPLTGREVEHG
jgi:dCMP deaminase